MCVWIDFLQMIEKYLQNSHATTHNQYGMKLLSVFALNHEKQSFKDVGNRWNLPIMICKQRGLSAVTDIARQAY